VPTSVLFANQLDFITPNKNCAIRWGKNLNGGQHQIQPHRRAQPRCSNGVRRTGGCLKGYARPTGKWRQVRQDGPGEDINKLPGRAANRDVT
jgi:hypothetical protein